MTGDGRDGLAEGRRGTHVEVSLQLLVSLPSLLSFSALSFAEAFLVSHFHYSLT